jgi:hypothetical protein
MTNFMYECCKPLKPKQFWGCIEWGWRTIFSLRSKQIGEIECYQHFCDCMGNFARYFCEYITRIRQRDQLQKLLNVIFHFGLNFNQNTLNCCTMISFWRIAKWAFKKKLWNKGYKLIEFSCFTHFKTWIYVQRFSGENTLGFSIGKKKSKNRFFLMGLTNGTNFH